MAVAKFFISMEEEELAPSLFHKNLVACNTREPWRVHIVSPDIDTTQRPVGTPEEKLIALRIIPNYRAPFTPTLFCVDTGVAVVAFSQDVPSERQTKIVELFVPQPRHETMVDMGKSQAAERFPMTSRVILLVRQVLAQLSALTCEGELLFILMKMVGEPVRVDTLTQIGARRYDVLDRGWLLAIKWARARKLNQDQQQQLHAARTLYYRVRSAYNDAKSPNVDGATERTLRNIMEDYYECFTHQ